MVELFNLGLSDNDIKNMIAVCPEIKELTDNEITNNIEILKSINCNERHIRNILICNPFYLNRTIEDISKLIKKLIEIGITHVNLIFDSNPYLLNKDDYEIDEYINKLTIKGKSLEEIVDDLDSNPFIIDEID